MRPCDLNQVVTRAIQKLDSQLEGKNVTITSHLDESLDKINLDCALFEKILISLMGNAFFRMKQEGEMEVVTGKDGGYAVLTLAYRMPFVSDDDIDHFFYPFVVSYPFPEESPNKHIMDIPICRVLIHKHGGIINVSKEKHDVVKITISLPYE
jgi:K+-sensing histidine kinase KdpD